MPIQQMLLGAGSAVASKNWIDDVFSTNVYTGAGSGQVINNGINNSSEGGMVWFKRRDGTYDHQVVDTIRGGNKGIRPNLSSAEITTSYISSFNNNGYTLGNEAAASQSGLSFSAWNFRKAPGFFTCLSYVGSGSNRTISHDLGCEPGMIIIKNLDSNEDWRVYHRSTGGTKSLLLNNSDAAGSHSSVFNNTDPTASVFTVGTSDAVNKNGDDFVAYLFAGGESTNALARSVSFDGNDDLTVPDSTDLDLGTTFTWEFWIKMNNLQDWYVPFRRIGSSAVWIQINAAGQISYSNCSSANGAIPKGQWTHCALVVNSGVGQWYINGTASGSTSSNTTGSGYNGNLCIGGWGDTVSYYMNGSLSNVRLVAGTAVYTSSFKPPTEPLANISGTVLLCCNNSSVTGSTVTPGTISSTWGTPTASTDSPFDDPAGFKFGDTEESVIKCGSYTGDGGAGTTEINLGWEPQWLLVKASDAADNWVLLDSMRGFVTHDNQANDAGLFPNTSDAESTQGYLDLTSTGFKTTLYSNLNVSGRNYIFTAIRRSDGYVGKPPELGTSVFSLTVGTGGTAPQFVTGFPMDFALVKEPAASANWHSGSRLTGNDYMHPNNTDTSLSASWLFGASDYNNGFAHTHYSSSTQAWSWKRTAGFDCIAYQGDGSSNRSMPHNLSISAEMIWTKNRDATENWQAWHKDLNGGGNNAIERFLRLNTADTVMQDTGGYLSIPTSTHYTIGNSDPYNKDGDNYIAMLFASVDKISKCGFYDGSSSAQTITLGFQPRLLIVKKYTGTPATNWYVIDTLRGWGSGDDKYLELSTNAAQADHDFGAPTSTGMTLPGGEEAFNASGSSYIYYAHA